MVNLPNYTYNKRFKQKNTLRFKMNYRWICERIPWKKWKSHFLYIVKLSLSFRLDFISVVSLVMKFSYYHNMSSVVAIWRRTLSWFPCQLTLTLMGKKLTQLTSGGQRGIRVPRALDPFLVGRSCMGKYIVA